MAVLCGRGDQTNMFLGFSRGSCCETKAQLLRAKNRNHIFVELYNQLNEKAENLIEQLSKFMNYLKKSNRKGSKFD